MSCQSQRSVRTRGFRYEEHSWTELTLPDCCRMIRFRSRLQSLNGLWVDFLPATSYIDLWHDSCMYIVHLTSLRVNLTFDKGHHANLRQRVGDDALVRAQYMDVKDSSPPNQI